MTRFDVVGLGLATIDILTATPRLPGSNEVLPVPEIAVQGGGPVATALVALARLGARTAYLGTVAQDTWGDRIVGDLANFSVNTDYVARVPGESPTSVILVEPNGNRAILFKPGRHAELPPESVPADVIASARVLHLDGWHMGAALEAARIARSSGVPVSFDGGAGEVFRTADDLLPLVDILIVARQFARGATGLADPLEAGVALKRFGARQVVITDGANGSWFWDDAHHLRQSAFHVPVQDTTGAGDSFHGGYLYATLQEWPAARCLEFASAVAAIKCTRLGGRAGLPSLPEVEAFLDTNKEMCGS